MRDLNTNELEQVYGAGGSGCYNPCGGNGGSKSKHSKSHKSTKKHSKSHKSTKKHSGSKGHGSKGWC